jgi:hypothetical protein
VDHLSIEQARKIKEALGPATGYLWRLVDRLVKVGLDVRDPKLSQLATTADRPLPIQLPAIERAVRNE